MCLGFCQPVSAGFQIRERVRGYLAVLSGCTSQINLAVATEFVVSINRILRFSFGSCSGFQLFQFELNITQGHIIAFGIFLRVLLNDIQSKLRVLQRIGQLNRSAAAGDGSTIGCSFCPGRIISTANFCS